MALGKALDGDVVNFSGACSASAYPMILAVRFNTQFLRLFFAH